MRSPTLLFIAALLVATAAPSVEAGRVKGAVKGVKSSPTTATRNLKDKDKKAKAIPTKKVKGPQTRSCKTSAKASQVTIECGTTRAAQGGKAAGAKDTAAKAGGVKEAKEAAGAKDAGPKEVGVKDTAAKEGEVKAGGAKEAAAKGGEPKGRTLEDPETSKETEEMDSDLTPSEQIDDSIKYIVKTNKKGIKLKIEYRQEVSTDISETETETEFELAYRSLVEYTKGEQSQRWGFNNGVSTEAYNWDTDEIVQVVPLKDWEGIPGISESHDGIVKFFTATANLESKGDVMGPTGTAHFNFTVSEATVGERVSSNSMKVDLTILNFPWQRRDSYIALMSTVDSSKKVHVDQDSEALVSGGKAHLTEAAFVAFDEEMQSLGLEAFGSYTWEKEADATTPDEDSSTAVNRDGGRRRAQEEEPTIVEDVSGKPGVKPVEIEHAAGSVVKIEVVATSPEEGTGDNYDEIAYSFIGSGAHAAAEIYWDPEAGVGYGETPVSAAWALQSMTWAASLAGALLLIW